MLRGARNTPRRSSFALLALAAIWAQGFLLYDSGAYHGYDYFRGAADWPTLAPSLWAMCLAAGLVPTLLLVLADSGLRGPLRDLRRLAVTAFVLLISMRFCFALGFEDSFLAIALHRGTVGPEYVEVPSPESRIEEWRALHQTSWSGLIVPLLASSVLGIFDAIGRPVGMVACASSFRRIWFTGLAIVAFSVFTWAAFRLGLDASFDLRAPTWMVAAAALAVTLPLHLSARDTPPDPRDPWIAGPTLFFAYSFACSYRRPHEMTHAHSDPPTPADELPLVLAISVLVALAAWWRAAQDASVRLRGTAH